VFWNTFENGKAVTFKEEGGKIRRVETATGPTQEDSPVGM